MLNITNNSYISKKLNFLPSFINKSSTLLSSSSSSSSSIQTIPLTSPSKINYYNNNNNNNNKYDKIVFFTFSLIIFILGIFSVIYLLEIITNNTTNDLSIKQSFNNYNNQLRGRGGGGRRLSLDITSIEKIVIEEDTELARARNQNCSYWDCFNVYKCGQQATGDPERIAIYVYPLQEFIDQSAPNTRAFLLTKEFYSILKTIIDSKYYTSNPNEACIFIPSVDILNEHLIQSNLIGKALATLPYWNNGENHLLFNVLSGKEPDFNTVIDVNTDRAMIAGAGFDTWTYRSGFDLAMPFISPLLENYKWDKINDKKRSYLLISAQTNLPGYHMRILQQLAYENSDILIFQKCTKKNQKVASISSSSSSPSIVAASSSSSSPSSASSNKMNQQNSDDGGGNSSKNRKTINKKNQKCSFPLGVHLEYPNVLANGIFCLFGRSNKRLGQPIFLEALAANCIPVIMADNIVLPFDEVIDWSLATVQIREADLHTIKTVLNGISKDKIFELQQQGKWLYEKYLKNINRIVLTILDELNDRVFPHLAKTYLEWNLPMNDRSSKNPLFLPLIAPKSQGFTAVILTYDRVDSLFTLIQKLSMVSSLQKILVIWNNQKKSPPHPSLFPKITKPLKVIQTKANKLSNRFYPYEDIETEAILTIDDDIIMLTADELDFGYEVWREFPDRIVGFPSRTHVWDNVTNRWRYESEWTNQISMVLTGAAFHHKYWSYMYTNAMPGDIKEWVDDHMNCEDIAMNFLVANITNKPPIKVAPRKKFKCPECTNTEMLSADLNHMLERSACIDRFAGIYGTMPLKSVEFRADPVLYKDNFPEKLKRFNDIGSL